MTPHPSEYPGQDPSSCAFAAEEPDPNADVRPRNSAAPVADPASQPGRLGVGIVGVGRVGAALGNALRAAGHAVVGVAAVSAASRERAELMLPGVPILSMTEVIERAELVLLTVPDDVLAPLVEGLAATGAWQGGQLVVHTAGRYGWQVLEPAARCGAIPLALHPAMTFTGTSLDVSRLTECRFAVSAPAAVLPIAQALVMEMGAEPVIVPEQARELYHAALAHSANHLVTLVAQSLELLRSAGIESADRLITPLLSAALDNALRNGDAALTGPVARGDAGTVSAHLGAIDPVSHEIGQTYRAMARATAERALNSGRLSVDQAQALLSALADRPQ